MDDASAGGGTFPPRPRIRPLAGAAAITVGALSLALLLGDVPQGVSDAAHYLAMAEGRWQETLAPFNRRLLAPLAARGLSWLTGLELARAFAALAVAGVFVVALNVVRTLQREGLPALAVVPVLLLVPVTVHTLQGALLPDALFAALVAVPLCALQLGRPMLAAALLPPVVLAHQAGLVLAAVLVGAAARRRDWAVALVGTLGAGAAIAIANLYPVAMPGNEHGMSPLAYFALKLPVNALHNVLGIAVWTDSFAWCHAPVVTFSLGEAPLPGRIREVGVCAPDPRLPARTFAVLLTVFGVLPGLALALLPRGGLRALRAGPPVAAVAAVYGALMLLLAPAAGKSLERLAAFGWPAFWLALPVLWGRLGMPLDGRLVWLAGLHLAVSWSPMMGPAAVPAAAALAIGLAGNGLAYTAARRWRPAGPPGEAAPGGLP